MARNYHAVIWTRISGEAEKMGDLIMSDEQISFTYTNEYLGSGQPGFCLLGDVSIWGSDTVSYPISERVPVFPRLISLIPGSNPRNLQRRHYLDILRAVNGKEPPPGIDTEWQLLMMGGHGGIGHVDVFSDDITALKWYESDTSERSKQHLPESSDNRSQLWRMLKRNVLDENVDFDSQVIDQVLGPTPSVGGMIPKLLVSIDVPDRMDKADSAINFYPPDTDGKINVILKVEPPEYDGMLDLESMCLDVHREAGFDVPDHYRFDSDGLRFLAIERFDRHEGKPVPMESLFSIIATGDHQFRENADLLLEELGTVFERLQPIAGLDKSTPEQMYRRILMALLTGNGDLHLDNTSILGGVKGCGLSPIYDPAPMRAWPRHDIVSAIPFDPTDYEDHGEYFVSLGASFGLSSRKVNDCLMHALDATSDYVGRVKNLKKIPDAQREQLIEIVQHERQLIKRHV